MAYIGLGGNLRGPLGGPAEYIAEAMARLKKDDAVTSLRTSGLYRTAAWGKTDQAEFLNAVARLRYRGKPESLLKTLLSLEDSLGRRRGEQWGPRLIDLDLLTFDDVRVDSPDLVLPHPHMHERAFVLVPLLELDPDFEIPGRGRADDCLATLDDAQPVVPA